MKILVTGGAGFIGSYLIQKLKSDGNSITILDTFHPQIHGASPDFEKPWLTGVEILKGGVEDLDLYAKAASDAEAIVHLAAETGTGQSMQEVARYATVNLIGTTNLTHLFANGRLPKLRRIVVASSRAIYGEGKYRCSEHGYVYPSPRSEIRMKRGAFEPICPLCGLEIEAVPNDEVTEKSPASFYGLTKQFQEESLLLMGRAFNISCVALRFQNVYGPRQSLKNPYTGVLTVFARQAFNGHDINVFEDGKETRDFVYVTDVVQAIVQALGADDRVHGAYNIGTGQKTPMLLMAELINRGFGAKSNINVSGEYRVGDIRHNYADISRARSELGYNPQVSIDLGVAEFCRWAKSELEAEVSSKAAR